MPRIAATEKPHILVFARFFPPGKRGGGPIRSVVNLVDQLSDEFTFSIVTRDRDLGDTSPYAKIRVRHWYIKDEFHALYLPTWPSSWPTIYKLVKSRRYSLIYLNSYFDATFTFVPLVLSKLAGRSPTRVIVAPRGEFSPGALAMSAWKKRIYRSVTNTFGIFRHIWWHASSGAEKEYIKSAMPGFGGVENDRRVFIAGNLTTIPKKQDAVRHIDGGPRKRRIRICNLARIARNKNLLMAIEVLAEVKVPVTFNIYGSIQDKEYWRTCEEALSRLPTNIEYSYEGEVAHSRVISVMRQHDLFFLPTKGENFGHAICEALCAGVPVLTTDKTPWGAIEAAGVGWCIELDDIPAFAEKIELVASFSVDDQARISNAAIGFVAQHEMIRNAQSATREMFRNVVRHRV